MAALVLSALFWSSFSYSCCLTGDCKMTYDLTSISVALIAGFFGVLGPVALAVINSRIKDAQAAKVLGDAVKNALGVMQQVSTGAIIADRPSVDLPALSPVMATGLQYVLDHAGPEALRFGISQEAIIEKIEAQLGLQAIGATPAPLAARLTAPGVR